MMRDFTPGERTLIEHARVARLATVGADGTPHAVPVCPALIDGRIVIGLEAGTRKHRNMLGDSRVAVLFDDYVEDWNALRGIMVSGRAVVLDGPERTAAVAALYEKFRQYPVISAFDADDPLVAIDAESVASWGFDEEGA